MNLCSWDTTGSHELDPQLSPCYLSRQQGCGSYNLTDCYFIFFFLLLPLFKTCFLGFHFSLMILLPFLQNAGIDLIELNELIFFSRQYKFVFHLVDKKMNFDC